MKRKKAFSKAHYISASGHCSAPAFANDYSICPGSGSGFPFCCGSGSGDWDENRFYGLGYGASWLSGSGTISSTGLGCGSGSGNGDLGTTNET